VVHVRCRAHEQGDDGSLARRLCAQLCGYDVQASLKYIIPLLGRTAAGAAAGEAQLDAEVDAELRLVCAMHGRCHLTEEGEAFDLNDLAHAAHSSAPCQQGAPCQHGARRGRGGGEGAAPEAEEGAGSDATILDSSSDEEKEAAAAAPGVGARLALLIDDLHLADQHSCRLLQKLAASSTARAGPLLIMVASRDEHVSLSKPRNGGDGRTEPRLSHGRRLVHALASQPSSLRVRLPRSSNPAPQP
jgi:hypothetical protein